MPSPSSSSSSSPLSLTVLVVLVVSSTTTLAYHQFREIVCSTPSGSLRGGPEKAKCHLVLKNEELEEGRQVPESLGSFLETTPDGEEREYFDIVCPNSHTVFNAGLNQGHRACFNYYTYQLEKRGVDWFMWRSGKCMNSTATFRVGCKFDDPFETQFPNDNEIFEKLRLRRA